MRLYRGDCLDIMQQLEDKSVDMILCDLPYGCTRNKWDIVIPMEPLWKQYERVARDNAAIVLFSNQPFTTRLIMSNLKMYRYEIIWAKPQGTDFLNANRKPLKAHENIEVFYKRPPYYNRKGRQGKPYRARSGTKSENWGGYKSIVVENRDGRRYNTTVYPAPIPRRGHHPTEKPTELLKWLIGMYTRPGDIVLDNCMGSGSTGVACRETGRDFIGIERDEKYFEIAKERIGSTKKV